MKQTKKSKLISFVQVYTLFIDQKLFLILYNDLNLARERDVSYLDRTVIVNLILSLTLFLTYLTLILNFDRK
jgi:hypothetical protein